MIRAVLVVAAICAAAAAPAAAQVRDLGPDLNSQIPPPLAIQGQTQGEFGAMARSGPPGGAIQGAWDKAEAEAGIYRAIWKRGESMRLRVREGMTATVTLPEWDRVSDFTLADQINFGAMKLRKHPAVLWIWVKNPGFDSNLTIIGDSGNIYPFYVRGEAWNSKNLPDLVAYIEAAKPMGLAEGVDIADARERKASVDALVSQNPEWLRNVKFDPLKIRHDRKMQGDDESAMIAPVWAYRDDRFTFLDYEDRVGPWPTVYQVKDGVDSPVEKRTSPDGRFLVVETTAPITLKLGEKVVCIGPES